MATTGGGECDDDEVEEEEEGRVKRRRMPAWSNWWVYVAVNVRVAERKFGKGFLERDL